VGDDSVCGKQWYRPAWAMDAQCNKGFSENRAEELARRSDVVDYLERLSATHPELLVFDPFDPLCGSASGDCTPLRKGKLIYRDDSHITVQGSDLLTGPFEQFLVSHGLARRPSPGVVAAHSIVP
jgi:hypothetical protein